MNLITNNKYTPLLKSWLITMIFLIILMISVGGLTRLTDSGLSITEWELFSGILPPLNEQVWINYFSLYKKIPQYYLLNNNMTLDQFKIIFLWEYIHRLLGRIIGLFFLIPMVFFIYKKILSKELRNNFLIIFSLILFQGLIGWYMVTSGLTKNVTVSHYRLSIHLFIAFLILAMLIWNFLNITNNKKYFFQTTSYNLFIKIYIVLIFLQVIIGAFVSGLDAGKIYQTWPLMGNTYFPDDFIVTQYSDLLNFGNHSLVQFFHRNLAYLIFVIIIYIGYSILKNKKKYLYNHYLFVFFVIFLQIFLGIITLVSNINILIASMHQVSSVILVIVSLNLYHRSIA
jgi:cytochrome c oxidase assembly protein subunit 15